MTDFSLSSVDTYLSVFSVDGVSEGEESEIVVAVDDVAVAGEGVEVSGAAGSFGGGFADSTDFGLPWASVGWAETAAASGKASSPKSWTIFNAALR